MYYLVILVFVYALIKSVVRKKGPSLLSVSFIIVHTSLSSIPYRPSPLIHHPRSSSSIAHPPPTTTYPSSSMFAVIHPIFNRCYLPMIDHPLTTTHHP